jgi:hypothetical protein
MYSSQAPLSPDLPATPIALTCGSCRAELSLSADRTLQQAEIATFVAAHSGHDAGWNYQVRVPLPRDGVGTSVLGSGSATEASPIHRLGLATVLSPAYFLGKRAWGAVSTRVLHRNEWHFV